MIVILFAARPGASETSIEKTQDGLDDPANCDRRYGGRLDASSRAIFFLFSDRLVHLSECLGMVCDVSEQEKGC